VQTFTKVGLEALLTPDNCVLLLIDHQRFQLADVNSHEPTMVMNNVTALAKTAKAFNIPTILTTVNEERGGLIFKTVQDVFPNQKPINRTFINVWEDKRVVDAVKKTGRKKLVIAALWSEMCLAMPAIHSMGDGYDVYVVTDASGGVSPEAHDMAIRRLVAAGVLAWETQLIQLRLHRCSIGRSGFRGCATADYANNHPIGVATGYVHWDVLQVVGSPNNAVPWFAPNVPAANTNGMF